ncbi:MAG: hypothetical protein SAK29_00475 [Scytonema sp. PMC 1069.18]|nr:hypothetical protein [Scytonema sp. PMC 1069.18]MEC4882592.1 hypothetical protein [Scytonema sp. PMC 1070.18]
MTQEEQDNRRSQYRIEYIRLGIEKLNLSQEAVEQLKQNKLITATIKVARPGYVPEGVEVRAHISPEIFTANIPDSMLHQLQDDPEVVSIQTAGHLRSL